MYAQVPQALSSLYVFLFKILYTIFIPSTRATCHAHLILLGSLGVNLYTNKINITVNMELNKTSTLFNHLIITLKRMNSSVSLVLQHQFSVKHFLTAISIAAMVTIKHQFSPYKSNKI
jgi:hypothetical protein